MVQVGDSRFWNGDWMDLCRCQCTLICSILLKGLPGNILLHASSIASVWFKPKNGDSVNKPMFEKVFHSYCISRAAGDHEKFLESHCSSVGLSRSAATIMTADATICSHSRMVSRRFGDLLKRTAASFRNRWAECNIFLGILLATNVRKSNGRRTIIDLTGYVSKQSNWRKSAWASVAVC